MNPLSRCVYSGEQKSNPTSLLSSPATSVIEELTVIPTEAPSSQSSVNAGKTSLQHICVIYLSIISAFYSKMWVKNIFAHIVWTACPCLLRLALGMQSLLQEITANPSLVDSLLSGPHVSSLLNCLSQYPDLAAQVTHTQFMYPVSICTPGFSCSFKGSSKLDFSTATLSMIDVVQRAV